MNIMQESANQFSNTDCNYERIEHWSKIFGAPVHKSGLFMPNDSRYNLSVELIKEEFKELEKEFESKNLDKLILEAGDLIWVVFRMFMELGVEPKDIISKIYDANMSKACNTLDEANQTVLAYESGTHPLKYGEKINCYYESVDNYFIVKRTDNNKILKSIKTKSL